MTDEVIPPSADTDKSIDQIISELSLEFQGFIRSRVASPSDAEDILQEVWLQFSAAWSKQNIQQPLLNTKQQLPRLVKINCSTACNAVSKKKTL